MLNKTKSSWCPFRPDAQDLDTIANDVSGISDIQARLLDQHDGLKQADRVAHQYQIAGGKISLLVATALPDALQGVGLFQTGAEYFGIGRVSTGLGTPHLETNPDFLGLMLAFQTADGQRVDFLAINDPSSPTDNHRQFLDVLHATAESAGSAMPLIGEWGEYDIGNFFAEQTKFGMALIHRMGPIDAARTLAHIVKQTSRTFRSGTAWQPYWTGIVEVNEQPCKFTMVPTREQNKSPGFQPGEHYLSDEWKQRQTAGNVDFTLYWIPYLDEERTPTKSLTNEWEEHHKQAIGVVRFPSIDPTSTEAKQWAALAAEMGGNPGNWVHDQGNSIAEPATEFGNARKLAYHKSQQGRDVLDPQSYACVFTTGEIGAQLACELGRRREKKDKAGHIDCTQ